ncbi:lytic transglycosylase domain-containing protein [Brevundimonas vesicularis]|uniref:lytic transglycosylase domain-containing protein n=1 Tax=Brevundimonas vesicularis TaxID=41276 RepID=UPI00358F1282
MIRAESGIDPHAVSSAGAMGRTQLMPDADGDMRRRHGLGSDPLVSRDNVSRSAYFRHLYDRLGSSGALAQSTGPGRYLWHLRTGRPVRRGRCM